MAWRGIILLFFLILPIKFFAKEKNSDAGDISRPVIGHYGIGIGSNRVVSTYLSPVEYSGFRMNLEGEWDKVMKFCPEKIKMHFEGNIGGSLTLLNPAKNKAMNNLDFNFSWSMSRYWRLPHRLTISAGGGIDLGGGILALLKNSNNPVSADIHAALNARTELTWQTAIGRLPILARMNLSAPILGAFFMPEYGETFYEIYLGNRKGLVHCLWPGNYPDLKFRIAFGLDFGRTAMEVGYMLQWRRTSANHLVERENINMFTINVIPGGLKLKPRSGKKYILPF